MRDQFTKERLKFFNLVFDVYAYNEPKAEGEFNTRKILLIVIIWFFKKILNVFILIKAWLC